MAQPRPTGTRTAGAGAENWWPDPPWPALRGGGPAPPSTRLPEQECHSEGLASVPSPALEPWFREGGAGSKGTNFAGGWNPRARPGPVQAAPKGNGRLEDWGRGAVAGRELRTGAEARRQGPPSARTNTGRSPGAHGLEGAWLDWILCREMYTSGYRRGQRDWRATSGL